MPFSSKSHNSSLLEEVDQPFDIVVGDHYGHCKVGSGLTNGMYRFSFHLLNRSEYVSVKLSARE